MDNFHLHIIHTNSSNYQLLQMELALRSLPNRITHTDYHLIIINIFDDIFIPQKERPIYSNNDHIGNTINSLQFGINKDYRNI